MIEKFGAQGIEIVCIALLGTARKNELACAPVWGQVGKISCAVNRAVFDECGASAWKVLGLSAVDVVTGGSWPVSTGVGLVGFGKMEQKTVAEKGLGRWNRRRLQRRLRRRSH
jgi:hypothetical protein